MTETTAEPGAAGQLTDAPITSVTVFRDGAVITIYTQPDRAKVRHLAANDQVTVNFNSTPHGTDVVVISGRAELVPGSPPPTQVPGVLEKYRARIEQMGYAAEWFDSYSLAIRVTPERAWTI